MKNLEKELLEELENNKQEILEDKYPEDVIREYVDSSVPVMTYDLLKLAESDFWLAVDEPEIMAFDGKNSAVNAIAGNVYERLMEVASDWLDKNQKE